MNLIKDIEDFCTTYEIDFSTIPLHLTDEINEFIALYGREQQAK